MLDSISHTQIWVRDQDEALDFYVGTLGLEVHTDADLGHMRFLTVNVAGHPETEIMLSLPGPPMLDPQSAEQLRELIAKGAGGGLIFRTADCRATYDKLRSRGVEFVQDPVEHFYGIDCALRDPSGNHIRIAQPAAEPAVASG